MKSYVLILLVIFLSIAHKAHCQGQREKIESDPKKLEKLENDSSVFNDIKLSIKINSENEYDKLLNTTDVTYLVFLYKRLHQPSQDVARNLVKIATKLQYLSSIMLVDCGSKYGQTLSECADIHTLPQNYPKIKLLVPPEYRFNPYTKKMNRHSELPWEKGDMLKEEEVYNFLTNNIISRSSKLSVDNIDIFTK